MKNRKTKTWWKNIDATENRKWKRKIATEKKNTYIGISFGNFTNLLKDIRGSANPEEDKMKEKHIQKYCNQTAEN